jgi:FkbM family methyltransferase
LPADLGLVDGLVVDVGANVGEWTDAALTVEPRARVLAFEPGADAYNRLRDRFRTDARVTVLQRAVGARNGDVDLHVTRHSHNVSLRPPRRSTGELYAGDGWEVAAVQRTNVVRLDDVIDEPVSVLKIDAQGTEREVLVGAERTLLRTAAVLMEVTFVSHYEQDSSFGELHEVMRKSGFILVGVSDPFHAIDGRVLSCDACYRRAPMA